MERPPSGGQFYESSCNYRLDHGPEYLIWWPRVIRLLFALLLMFSAAQSFAAIENYSSQSAASTACNNFRHTAYYYSSTSCIVYDGNHYGAVLCQRTPDRTDAQTSSTGTCYSTWPLIEYRTFYFTGCPEGTVPDPQGGVSCTEPVPSDCPAAGTPIILQFAPNSNPVSKGGCDIEQTGDSTCTGTAAEGGYCVAPYAYTGTGMQDPNAVDDSTEWGGSGSTPNPDYTGAGSGTDGSTTTTTTSTSSTGSSSSTSTTTDNGDGTTTTETTGSSSGTTSGTTTEETTSNGTASASGKCGYPPSCSGGDPQLCAILRQQYEAMCSGEQVTPEDFTNGLEAGGLSDMNDLQGSWWDQDGNSDDLSADVTAQVNSALSSPGSTGTCTLADSSFSLLGNQIVWPLSKLCTVVDAVRAILYVISTISAGLILMTAVARP